ncbi:hypothetical protein ACN4EW_32180 [Arthrospira platensis CENA650]
MDYESLEVRLEVRWLYFDWEFELHVKSTFWLVLDFYISLKEIYLGIPIKEWDGGIFRYTGKDYIVINYHTFRPDDSIFWREKLITVDEPDSEDLIPF